MIKMLLILVFSVAFTRFFLVFFYYYISSMACCTAADAGSTEMPRMSGHTFKNIFLYIYMQPASPCPPYLPFPAVSREELSLPGRAGPGSARAPQAGRAAPQLTQIGGELHQIALVPGHLVLLQALVVCARLVSSGNRRSLKCQRGGLTNSVGINFNERTFLRKTAKLKKKNLNLPVCAFFRLLFTMDNNSYIKPLRPSREIKIVISVCFLLARLCDRGGCVFVMVSGAVTFSGASAPPSPGTAPEGAG